MRWTERVRAGPRWPRGAWRRGMARIVCSIHAGLLGPTPLSGFCSVARTGPRLTFTFYWMLVALVALQVALTASRLAASAAATTAAPPRRARPAGSGSWRRPCCFRWRCRRSCTSSWRWAGQGLGRAVFAALQPSLLVLTPGGHAGARCACQAGPREQARRLASASEADARHRPCCPTSPPLQTQRQLQLSLEAHSRYITSLLEQSELKGQLPAGLVHSSSGAAGPPAAPAAAAAAASREQAQQQAQQQVQQAEQPQAQQRQAQAAPPLVQQQAAPQQAQRQQPAPAPPKQEQPGCAGGSVDGGTTAGTGSVTGYNAPASTLATVSVTAQPGGSALQPPSPGTLLHRDVAGLAAAWDLTDAAALRKLQGGGVGDDDGPKRQRVG